MNPVGKDGRRFGSVVLSEILEHLEDPVGALRAAAAWMRPGAWLWVNVPVNSPAPDHIFLLRTPEEAVELVRTAGFTPVDTAFYPMTGRTLDEARTGKADDLGHSHREALTGRLGPAGYRLSRRRRPKESAFPEKVIAHRKERRPRRARSRSHAASGQLTGDPLAWALDLPGRLYERRLARYRVVTRISVSVPPGPPSTDCSLE